MVCWLDPLIHVGDVQCNVIDIGCSVHSLKYLCVVILVSDFPSYFRHDVIDYSQFCRRNIVTTVITI